MELRELEYFLAVARCGTLSEAARSLYLSQPALTRSLKHLEGELGKQLLIRGSRQVELTEEGLLLRRRAEEILQMTNKAKAEIKASERVLEGDIFVCSGETKGLHFLTQAAKRLMEKYPGIRLHVSSGDNGDVLAKLEEGMADFGLVFPPFDEKKYSSIRVPFSDIWGVFMRKEDPLAGQSSISPWDLADRPLIVSREIYEANRVGQIVGLPEDRIRVAATYSLLFNGVLMVTDGVGYLLGLDKIINLTGETVQCFRPLQPRVADQCCICWKRYGPMSRQAAALLEEMHRQEQEEVQFLFSPLSL